MTKNLILLLPFQRTFLTQLFINILIKHISYFHQMMEQQLKGGVTPRTWYREHAHPVLLPLDEEETHLLRSLVGAARQLNHHVILIHHALDGPESKELDDLAGSLQGTISL